MRALPIAVLCSALAFAPAARAAPTWADKETARELFKAGKEARAAGDPNTALERFTGAHALAPTPVTALELAKMHAQLGHFVQARELSLEAFRMPESKTETEKSALARVEAVALADTLKGRIATLTVRVVVTPSAPASLEIDGKSVAAAEISAAQRLDPGPHVVSARSGNGGTAQAEIALRDGESKEIVLEVVGPMAEAAAPVPATTPAPGRKPKRTTNPLVWIGFGVAAAGVVVGSSTGIVALSKAAPPNCEGARCTADGLDDIETGRTLATASTISFLVAGGGAALAIYGLLTPGRAASARSVHVLLGAPGLGIAGSF